jgi:hypothetical protein
MAFHVYPVVVLRWNEFHFALCIIIGIEHLNGIDATGSDLGKLVKPIFLVRKPLLLLAMVTLVQWFLTSLLLLPRH